MTKKIALLQSDVINQIAAGEVLENPASAVKELVENSIDAESSRIEVKIKGGGHQWIRVDDDGIGMGRLDAIECLQRHATSKIRSVNDLLKLATMGFRGEALAAIASVSQMELETADGEESSFVKIDAGQILSVDPSARNRGTTIDIRSLFYNVPARLKFQKSASSSASQILRTIQTLALAHPEIAFRLISQEKETFSVNLAPDWKTRCQDILGDFSHEIGWTQDGYSVYGLAGAPELAKGNRSGQYVFLNQRPIFSPLIARAISDGYATRVLEGKYPPVVLFLQLPTDEFDVNVHPQKRDVRFQNESKVYRLIERAISRAFEGDALSSFASPLKFEPRVFPWDEGSLSDAPSLLETAVQTEMEILPSLQRRPIALIGSFALLDGSSLVLLDLKGAESRILFENMQKPKPSAHPLLFPLEIPLSLEEVSKADFWISELGSLGVEARLLGAKTLVIDTLPFGIEPEDVPDFLASYKTDRKLASMVCRFCRARKKIYSLEEALRIDQKLSECKDSLYDPIGRPICREIKEEQVSEWFIS